MTPESKLKEGRLDEALQLLTVEVRNNPADAKRRVFLFQLLALLGQWERAQNQLNVSGELEPLNAMMVGAYTEALKGEAVRTEVFAGARLPVIIGEPEQWLALLLQALKLDAQGRHEQAADLREQAFELAAAVSGSIDGVAFEWIADADPRLGPCLEIVVNGGYSWVPFSRLRELKFEAPTDLRDKIWVPAEVTWTNGGKAIGFVPGRYPGSERSGDNDLVQGRKTEWVDGGGGLQTCLGQRMLATDAGEYPLLDARLISFDVD
ncbi:MAG: type VI secretion system accessory protein TagJ [Rhodanobacter sp.]|jgi:type VI secretion system protein ImpE|uniref:type VI secretion system accessory protein TagJ n=1 Tax=Rhodanobacter sp. KK11 TaxID=3083255 RepID=UPI0029660576|nr:type VI secretion system accessory protein TagJ [Rhodanobacter sp. KK11]MDW2982046.1 type VI secretion system accessory protein TagJ [Rhodanobacter sp. KK11]